MVRNRKLSVFAIVSLILAFALSGVILSLGNMINADAYTATSTPLSIGKISFDDYATRTDGKVFDGEILKKLYGALTGNDTDTYANALDAVKDSTSTITAPVDGNANYPMTQTESMDYSQIKTANGGTTVTLEFGGYKWNVVYATANTNDSTVAGRGDEGDLIVTLWMSDVDSTKGLVNWTPWTSNDTSKTYYSGEYSTSKIRIDTLNCGDINGSQQQYATGLTSASTPPINAATRVDHSYAKFTLSNAALAATAKANTSLIDYLATPTQVNYQEEENSLWSFVTSRTSGGYLAINEAWGEPDTTIAYKGKNGYFPGINNNSYPVLPVLSHTTYKNWTEDYLWLPSVTETGCNAPSDENRLNYNFDSYCVSLWGIPRTDDILKASSTYWTRTADTHWTTNAVNYIELFADGRGSLFMNAVSTSGVRPALHLNLTKADKAALYKLNVPSKVTKIYNGSEQGIEDSFTSEQLSFLTIQYYESSVLIPNNKKPIVRGSYTAKVTINGNDNAWADGLDGKTREVAFEIKPKPIKFPSVDGESSDVYSGDTPVKFYIKDYDSTFMNVTIPSKFASVVTTKLTSGDPYVDALGVGKYNLDITLKDTKNYTWSTSNPKFEFEVTKAPVNVSIYDTSGGGLNYALRAPQGTTIAAYIEVATGNINTGKNVTALIMAYRNSIVVGQGTEIGSVDLDSDSTIEDIVLDLSELRKDTQYILGVEFADGNYTGAKPDGGNYEAVMSQTTTLDVLDPSLHNTITWRLTADGKLVANKTAYSELNEFTKTFTSKIIYDGKKYGFMVSAPNGYTLDTDYGIGGYEITYGNSDNSNPFVNADRYTVNIRLINDANVNEKTVYSLEWKIEKAKFDLSNVKWLGNGKMEYNDGDAVEFTIDEKTLPDGLLVDHYDGVNVHYDVDVYAPVTVTFKLADGYEDNYVLPEQGGKDTNYIFTGTDDFEWEKELEIVPGVFKLEWVKKEMTDKNGNTFSVYVLKDPRADGKVSYTYYPTNSSGQIDGSKQPLARDDIEVSATNRQYFKAFPSINRGYELCYNFPSNTPGYSPVFDVGGGASSVKVSLETDKYEYNNGKPVKLKIGIDGTATLSQLSLTYYEGDVIDEDKKLDGAPTEVGNYLVVIKSTTSTVILSGTTQFEFEITQCRIAIDWNTDAKPPVLNLKYGQINGVEYEIFDSEGNKISNMSQITPGDYTILAKIKDSQVRNYIFDDDTYVTAFVNFTVRENDQLYDPNSPTNPHYPQTDPDNPTPVPGDESGSNIKDFFEKLIASHFPLWQVAVMAVSAILALIFIIKAAQYGSRAKKAKGETKKLNAKTYAALLPVFAGDIVALGLSNKIWSIMAFAFAGFALLMLAVALITRRSWKKAELAKEAATEDNEQRKTEAQEAKQLAREEAQEARQRELQETLILASQGGGQGADNGVLIEQMRMEMEAQEARYREELARRDEEQAKRDETMKIMLANLMGRSAGDDTFAYASMDDTDMLVQRVIAGLLPAMQQMMPEATAYLNAPNSEENEELKALVEEQKALVEEQRAIVEEQNEEIRNISMQMVEMQAQLETMSQERVDGVLIPDGSDEKMAEMADTMREQLERIEELQSQIEEMSQNNEVDSSEEMQAMADAMQRQLKKIEELQAQLAAMEQERVDGVLLPDQSDGMKEMLAKMEELQAQLAAGSQEDGEGIVIPDQSEEIKALTEQIAAMREQLAERPQTITNTVYVERETDEEDTDDEEEWDSILDEEDDFIEATIVDADGTVRKTTPNFRMRLKESSEKNREWYAAIKNLFCSQKGITYRVYKRVEKIRYQGSVIAVIGIAKRSLKLWLALKPYEYDARRYHHRDVSDKPRFVDVPLYVRVGSDRALTRAQELILALFQEQSMEARKRYTDRDIQELIFTLKHNRLLANKDCKQLLCEVMHVHDCDILSNEVAEKCIETKNVDYIDESVIETVKLDGIDANFLDGNRVTLDKLKKVGLVSEKCTGYTVAAGQRLTKPLIIVANDFTLEAVKMIALTGGRVIKLAQVAQQR